MTRRPPAVPETLRFQGGARAQAPGDVLGMVVRQGMELCAVDVDMLAARGVTRVPVEPRQRRQRPFPIHRARAVTLRRLRKRRGRVCDRARRAADKS